VGRFSGKELRPGALPPPIPPDRRLKQKGLQKRFPISKLQPPYQYPAHEITPYSPSICTPQSRRIAGLGRWLEMWKKESMTKRELVHLKRDAILQAASSLGVERIRLFGSVARGDEHDASDVDFIVRMRPEM
jgi:Nucleotidyltransferase domain